MLNRSSQVPLYIQLADTLREQIKEGKIKVGDKLPSESEMISYYRLGRLTVRDALSVLVNEGLIEKKHGKGTFCKTNHVGKKYRVDILLNLQEAEFIPFYLRSICAVLESEDVNIVMADTRNDADVICNLLENAISEESDGVIFQPTNCDKRAPEKIVAVLDKLATAKIPYIMIDTYYRNVPEAYVVMDEYRAGKIAADYFTSTGHTSLLTVLNEKRVDFGERTQGFRESLNFSPATVEYSDKLSENLLRTLKERKDITGIFCFNDGLAKQCYDILGSAGISIPEQISVISVDDTVVASAMSPALTSVMHPKERLGKAAAKAILLVIKGEAPWPYKKVFEPALAIRKSCTSM